jgi:hypothetical protein
MADDFYQTFCPEERVMLKTIAPLVLWLALNAAHASDLRCGRYNEAAFLSTAVRPMGLSAVSD